MYSYFNTNMSTRPKKVFSYAKEIPSKHLVQIEGTIANQTSNYYRNQFVKQLREYYARYKEGMGGNVTQKSACTVSL